MKFSTSRWLLGLGFLIPIASPAIAQTHRGGAEAQRVEHARAARAQRDRNARDERAERVKNAREQRADRIQHARRQAHPQGG